MDCSGPSEAVNVRTRTRLGSPSRVNSLCSPAEHVSRGRQVQRKGVMTVALEELRR